MRVRYLCHYGALTGYGRAARDYLAALHGAGVELEIGTFGPVESPEPRYRHLDKYARPFLELGPSTGSTVTVIHAQPRLLEAMPEANLRAVAGGGPIAALTTWETSDLPLPYFEALKRFDRVIVPSHFCADVVDPYVDAPMPVRVIPHCFDPAFWALPTSVDAPSTTRFYTIGAWGERKNPIGILKAYLSEFSRDDNVQLTMYLEGCDFNEVRSLIARSGLKPEQLPRISIPDNPQLAEDELVKLHVNNDVFVSATRGEGWGLGLFEAAVMGKWIISPLYGGQSDFLDEYARCAGVPYQFTPCFGTEVRGEIINGQQLARVSIPPGTSCRQRWAEPDLGALASEMRYAHMHATSTRVAPTEVWSDREPLERQFSYKTVGELFANTLREMIS